MGGGGHAGAVSFRVQPQDEKKFLAKVNKVFDFIKDNFNRSGSVWLFPLIIVSLLQHHPAQKILLFFLQKKFF